MCHSVTQLPLRVRDGKNRLGVQGLSVQYSREMAPSCHPDPWLLPRVRDPLLDAAEIDPSVHVATNGRAGARPSGKRRTANGYLLQITPLISIMTRLRLLRLPAPNHLLPTSTRIIRIEISCITIVFQRRRNFTLEFGVPLLLVQSLPFLDGITERLARICFHPSHERDIELEWFSNLSTEKITNILTVLVAVRDKRLPIKIFLSPIELRIRLFLRRDPAYLTCVQIVSNSIGDVNFSTRAWQIMISAKDHKFFFEPIKVSKFLRTNIAI